MLAFISGSYLQEPLVPDSAARTLMMMSDDPPRGTHALSSNRYLTVVTREPEAERQSRGAAA